MPSSVFVVLIPVYDDWDSVRALLPLLDTELSACGASARILLVDDGSVVSRPADLVSSVFAAISHVDVLVLKRNIGHQRAICIGLCACAANADYKDVEGVIVMDADGEDKPSDVPKLIEDFRSNKGSKLVFASRERRSEGVIFTLFYRTYRVLHVILTGVPVRIGNFSIVPYPYLDRLSVVSELWNHYAAAVVHARMPMDTVPTMRGRRYFGESKMNFTALVSHGLSAMSVFGDRIGVRALIATVELVVLLALAFVATIAIRAFTPFAIPGWATSAIGLVGILVTQSVLLWLALATLIYLGRAGTGFLPARDYGWFVERLDKVWGN